MAVINREQLAQDTAEYIANTLMPETAKFHASPGVTIHYANDERPPADVDTIKATLLDGTCWISWMDDRVTSAMRALHGTPTGDAEWLAAIAEGDKPECHNHDCGLTDRNVVHVDH